MGRAHDFQSLFNLPCEYLFSDRMKEFREAAAKRCESVAELFFAGGRRGEYDPRFLDYSLFSHRDADGRTALELFLKEEGLLLPSEEREAIARFRGAAYGLFEIEEVHRRSFRARRAGTDDRFAVKASRER